jgi:hypothetical protein
MGEANVTATLASERFIGSSLTTVASPPLNPTPLVSNAEQSVSEIEIRWPQPEVRPWYVDLTERELNRLIDLGEGWDGGRARAVTLPALRTTVEVLARLLTQQSPRPQFFPLPDGGIQVEWLVAGNSVVIEVDAQGEAYVLATTSKDSEVADGIISRQTPELMRSVAKFLSALSNHVEKAN